ncbi:MAG: 3-hydroxyacyl-CoA dehydrogenase family protein [Clostridia bacterium]|nr:3-hydroxyacyl-CoA dehydrogenase family protein [Clostridia bacterium]
MGAEIALCFAKAEFEVFLGDMTAEIAVKGKEKQEIVLDKSIKKGKFDPAEKEAVLNRVVPTGNLSDMAECDFIVEAVVEVLEVKSELYKKLDGICKEDCIIASNTSSISITKLASAVSSHRVGKFIGTHFNSPASIMKLVEVIPGQLTNEETIKTTTELLYVIEKEPIKVKDVTGFALNRLFHVFTAEACRLLDEGVASAEDIDKVCVYGLGHPVGIFKLLDLMGHDLNIKVDQILFEAYGERFRPSPAMQRLVDAGLLGKKTGKGFHDYTSETHKK